MGIIVIGITLKCAIYAQTPTKHPSHHHCCCHHHRYRRSRDFGNAGDGERVIKFMKLLPTQHFMLAMFLIKLFLTHNRCHYWCFGAVNAIMTNLNASYVLNESILRPNNGFHLHWFTLQPRMFNRMDFFLQLSTRQHPKKSWFLMVASDQANERIKRRQRFYESGKSSACGFHYSQSFCTVKQLPDECILYARERCLLHHCQ